MKKTIEYACISHIGNIRQINQDNYICDGKYHEDIKEKCVSLYGEFGLEKAHILGIFDGLGGEQRGEIASLIAARKASSLNIDKDIIDSVTKYCLDVNSDICEYITQNSLFSMGTTAAMMVFGKKEIVLCNIGDSRIYRLSDNQFSKISYDHILDSSGGQKPLLSQKLGTPLSETDIIPYFSKGRYLEGDRYLICSDGLTDMVSEEDIKKILLQNNIKESADKLLKSALENGGRDNISIIVAGVKKRSIRGK